MKKIFILNFVIFCSIYAQDLHEFSMHIGGGLSTLRYDPTFGEQSNNFDKQFGVGYAFFVSPRFGFATGLELAFYSADFELKRPVEMVYQAKDLVEAVDFTFRSNLSNYTEEQSAIMLQIPLMLQFQTEMGFYAMAGVKFAIPISGGSSAKGDLKNSGYYEKENCEYYISDCIDMPQNGPNQWSDRGFGLFKGKKTENRENFESSIFASMEMGVKWRFEDGLSLYTAAYFDYGLGNILKKRDLEELSRMVEYNSADPQNFAMNSMLNSYHEQIAPKQAFINKIMPMAIGIKVKLSLSQGVDYFANKDKAKLAAAAEARQVEAEKRALELNLARSEAAEKALVERETERLAAAERLLQDARLAYELALNDRLNAARNEDVRRLAAETPQIEQEVARLSSPQPDYEFEPFQPFEPTPLLPETESNALRDSVNASGDWVIQVAVVMQKTRAGAIVNSLKRKGFNAYSVQVTNPGKLVGTYHRVRVGYFGKMRDASDFAKANLSTYKDWWLDRTENDAK